MKCKYCGCDDEHACVGGCSWVIEEVCSQCVLSSAAAKRFIDSAEFDIEISSGDLKFIVFKKQYPKSKKKIKPVHLLDSRNYYKCNMAVGHGVCGIATKNISLVTCQNCLKEASQG